MMAQKSGAVKALTGGIAHLFKQNKVRPSPPHLLLMENLETAASQLHLAPLR